MEELKQICNQLERSDETLTLLNLSCRGVCSEGIVKMADAACSRHRHRHHHHHPCQSTTTMSSSTTPSSPTSPPLPTTSLIALWLEGNEIYSSGGKALRRLLDVSPHLKYLYISNNHIGDGGMNALAPAITTQLQVCHIGDNDIGPVGTYGIANALSSRSNSNTTTTIDNNINDDTINTNNNPTKITTLVLDNNRLGDEGAKILADALKYNTSLKHLDLRYNKIGMDGLVAFRDMLKYKHNTTLQYFYFEEIDEPTGTNNPTSPIRSELASASASSSGTPTIIHCTRAPPRRRVADGQRRRKSARVGTRDQRSQACQCNRCKIRSEIEYYLALNRSGRSQYCSDMTVPYSCWSRIMARATQEPDEPSILYTMLTDRPDVPTVARQQQQQPKKR